MRSLLAAVTALMLLSGCSSAQISDYENTSPELNLRTFFDGPLVASGVVIDRSNKVTRTFTVDIQAGWQDDTGTIEEWFVFNDGEKTTRTWVLKDLGDGRYTGTAGDVIGEASGQTTGFAFHWLYTLEIEIDGSKYEVGLDDWMYLVNDGEILNRSYITKWGFNVGEVILSIRKVPD